VARDAVRQGEERLQPAQLGPAEPLDLFPRVSPGDHRAQGAGQDVRPAVLLAPVEAGVGQAGERFGEGLRHWESSVTPDDLAANPDGVTG
jgi:hypothetical protein